MLAGVAVAIVVVLGVIFVLKFGPTNTGKEAAAGAQPVDATVLAAVTQIPSTVFDAVGMGSASSGLKALSGAPALEQSGRPEMLYIGAEFCPYCAAERWAMVAALSRFGTFANLHTMRSSSSDSFPNTPTFTFYQSTFDSQYLTFTAVEHYTNQPIASGGYSTLQDLSSDQQSLMNKYDSGGSIPFVDVGGKYSLAGATYDPGILAGMSWQQIATKLSDTSSPQTQGIIGSANLFTAAICQVTNQQPGDVCGSGGVQKAAAQLPKS